MKIDRKASDKPTAAKSSRLLKPKAAKKKGAVDKAATAQKTGVVAVIGGIGKRSKKKAVAAMPAPIANQKAVRDDFKMPASDYALIDALKQRALEFNRPTKKNELLRAGLHALGALDNTQLQQRLLALSSNGMKKPVAKPAKRSRVKV